jgi:hypothetical protein
MVIADGTGSPVTHTVTLDRGDTVIGPLSAKLNEIKDVEARGGFKTSVHGKRIYPTIKFSAWFSSIDQDATAPGSLFEMVTATGSYSANISTLGTGRPYHVKVTLTLEGTDFGDSADFTIVLNDVHFSVDAWNESEDGNFIGLTGTIKGSVVFSNGTNTATFAGVN